MRASPGFEQARRRLGAELVVSASCRPRDVDIDRGIYRRTHVAGVEKVCRKAIYPFAAPLTMTRVLLTGGSGFIAAHVLDYLLEHGHSVVTTVRSQQKADKIKEAHPKYGKDKLDFSLVEAGACL